MPHGPGVTGICTGGGLKVTITPVVVGMGDFSGAPIAPFAGGATRPASRLAGPHLKTTRGYSGPPLSYWAWLTPRGAGVRSNDHILSRGLGARRCRLGSLPQDPRTGGVLPGIWTCVTGAAGGLGASRTDFGSGGPDPTLNFTLAGGCPSAKNLLIVYRPLRLHGSP